MPRVLQAPQSTQHSQPQGPRYFFALVVGSCALELCALKLCAACACAASGNLPTNGHPSSAALRPARPRNARKLPGPGLGLRAAVLALAPGGERCLVLLVRGLLARRRAVGRSQLARAVEELRSPNVRRGLAAHDAALFDRLLHDALLLALQLLERRLLRAVQCGAVPPAYRYERKGKDRLGVRICGYV